MAISHKYTLLCDDIRQENTGKFIILGLYTPDIHVPAVPFALPALSFFVLLEADRPGVTNISFRLTQGDRIIAGGSGQMSIARVGVSPLPLRLGNLQFPSAGPYVFTLDIEGSAQITHEFSVILAVQNTGPAPAAAGGSQIH